MLQLLSHTVHAVGQTTNVEIVLHCLTAVAFVMHIFISEVLVRYPKRQITTFPLRNMHGTGINPPPELTGSFYPQAKISGDPRPFRGPEVIRSTLVVCLLRYEIIDSCVYSQILQFHFFNGSLQKFIVALYSCYWHSCYYCMDWKVNFLFSAHRL